MKPAFVVLLLAAVVGLLATVWWLQDQASAVGDGGTAETLPGPSGLGEATEAWPIRFERPAGAEPLFDRVVLVTLDTVRADHLQSYGYFRPTSPFLDRLAAEGSRFENAVASISHTAPSHATMLTGLPPAVHGVLENGLQLSPEATDLASMYGAAGFETAAFLNIRFLTGVTASFDTVDVKLLKGRLVVDAAIRWLQEVGRSQRFFLWVHLYDPHRWKELDRVPRPELNAIQEANPLDPEAFYDRISELHGLPNPGPGEPLDLGWNVEIKGRGRIETRTEEEFLAFMDAYDALILYTDRQIERLYEAIEGLDLPGRTLWIVTSDHGEGLGSHQVAGHGARIYQEQLRVPLILHASDGSLARDGPIVELVQHVDLLPTCAEALGGSLQGLDTLLNGASLWPLISGGDAPWVDRPAFSQRKPVEPVDGGQEEKIYALQTDRYKYILHLPGDDEFFDLGADPLELINLAEGESRQRDALKNLLEARLELYSQEKRGATEEDIPEEWLEELRALGYIR